VAKRKRSARLRPLEKQLAELRPDVRDADALIRSGEVLVDGAVRVNPASLVSPDSSIVLREDRELRGRTKLRAALDAFQPDLRGAVALDAGAAAGGFVQALLDGGASRVYAVEVGYGQLLGSLRQDPRVVNLERTNIGELDEALVPEAVQIITLDLGYLALATAVPQLNRIQIDEAARLIALVKPTTELGLGELATEDAQISEAVGRARSGIEDAGWHVVGTVDSPIEGSRGAREVFIHGERKGGW
jgi:23S rRNA (cytidine1920-2'-O)/16S rRNA (cytidine1409-2'-O)-methyltransferase